jgi:hypothetical protein
MGDTWAVDLKDMAAVYPWLGLEGIMVIAAIIAWLLWHYIQIRDENRQYEEDMKLYGGKEGVKKALDEPV